MDLACGCAAILDPLLEMPSLSVDLGQKSKKGELLPWARARPRLLGHVFLRGSRFTTAPLLVLTVLQRTNHRPLDVAL